MGVYINDDGSITANATSDPHKSDPCTKYAEWADVLRPIGVQDVRLAVGGGNLTPADVLACCNAELRHRRTLINRSVTDAAE